MNPMYLFSLAESGGVNLFPEFPEVFWTVLNFSVLAWGLYKLLYKPLLGAISAREDEIESSLKQAAEDRAEAERLRLAFEAKMAEAQRQAHEILQSANQAAAATKEQAEAEAREKAEIMIANAARTIEREKAKALAELREEVANLAVSIAGKVIDQNLNNVEQQRLADRFVAEVGKN